jgi:phage-related tail protein
VDFEEPEGFVALGNTIKEMSRNIPISAEGLAQITAAGGQLGVKEKDLAAFTETVSKMSTAFDMLPDEAGQAMAQLSNVFQIPMQNMNNLGDAINHLSNNMAAKAKDIIPALNRAGGSVRQFGLEAEQAAALVACKVAGLALGYAWTFIKGGILAVMTIWKTVSLAFATNPVGVVVATLAGAALLIITNWTKVKEFFSTIWEKIQPIWEKFAEFVNGFWNTISAPFKAIGKAWNWITGQAEPGPIKNEKAKIIKDASGTPLKNMTPINSNKTQNNNFTINISGKDVGDPEVIKAEIEKMLESKDSGALYDFVAEAY